MKPALLGGKVFEHAIDGWLVTWESRGPYRHWALLQRSEFDSEILVVMKNPGSLRGDGSNLRRDTSLRILRKLGDAVSANMMVANLFDFADPKPEVLRANWKRRDGTKLVYPHLAKRSYEGILFAHGDPVKLPLADYVERIAHVRSVFKRVPEITGPKTKAGYPAHTLNWQRHKLIPKVIAATQALLEG